MVFVTQTFRGRFLGRICRGGAPRDARHHRRKGTGFQPLRMGAHRVQEPTLEIENTVSEGGHQKSADHLAIHLLAKYVEYHAKDGNRQENETKHGKKIEIQAILLAQRTKKGVVDSTHNVIVWVIIGYNQIKIEIVLYS